MGGEQARGCQLVVIQKYQSLTPRHAGSGIAGGSGPSMIQSQVLELEFEPQRLDRVAAPIGRSVIDHDDFKLVGAQ
jgi:hypothetical protein